MVFIHIGLPKTGTTLLQQKIFNIWPNLIYMNNLWLSYLVLQDPNKKYLISNETLSGRPWNRDPRQSFDWLKERELILDALFRLFPQGTILVGFRKHADFIESLYAQYLQEGGIYSLEEFFSFNDSGGVIRAYELNFTKTLEMIEFRFKNRYFVFTFNQLLEKTRILLTAMGNLFGEPLPPDLLNLDLTPENLSVGYWQSKLLRFLNKIDKKPGTHFKPTGLLRLTNTYTKMLRIDPRSLCQDRLRKIFYRRIRLPQHYRTKIEQYFYQDWQDILKISEKCISSYS